MRGIAADPSGATLAVANAANSLETYAITADGSLSPTPLATIATTRNALTLLAFGPDQPPLAALSTTLDGSTAQFDANASQAVNGTIARYDWTFGDGTVLADGGPAPNHTYAALGDYTVTVTLTDSTGCSTAETFTAETPSPARARQNPPPLGESNSSTRFTVMSETAAPHRGRLNPDSGRTARLEIDTTPDTPPP